MATAAKSKAPKKAAAPRKVKAVAAPVEVIPAFKGFDKNMQCRGFQFAFGETYTHEGAVSACNSGFHVCTNPFDVWRYYPPAKSRYANVDYSGKTDTHEGDSKLAVEVLAVKAEISLPAFIKIGIMTLFKRAEADKTNKSGDYSTSATSGYYSTSATSGYYSTSATSGDYSTSATSGYYSTSATSGDSSTSATSGYYSTSATSSDSSTSATSGYYSTSATSGDYSTSATSGYYSTSATSGYYSTSATSGDYSTSATSGDYSTSATSGDSSTSATSGDSSTSATSGYYSTSATSGYYSTSAATGKNSVALATGVRSSAKASLGSILLVAEYDDRGNLIDVLKGIPGKDGIRADTFYRAQTGKLVEA